MSHRLDTIETLANTCGGFVLAFCVSLWVFPLLGIPMNPISAGAATAVMWCVSTIRLYCFRRAFRWWENRDAHKCKHCGKRFRSRETLLRHIFTEHRRL